MRKAAERLLEVETGNSYGTPALKVGKKSFCRVKDADTVVLMVDLEEKEMLMAAAPELFFETDHYKGWPAVLLRIHEVSPDELAHRLERAWLRMAPKKLVKRWRDGGSPT
ncbi:MmcQ/YjbR family DNA-binding protein [Mesorhizobium sp. 1B3]|uniref:MmcQ/YjbR family DNA-binding protein n=1 Tax=Mesorhizobium sp. 1B3 TaxID=3243599 RepID=UPI003D96140D